MHNEIKTKTKTPPKNHCLKDFLRKTLKLVVEKENVKKISSTPAQKEEKGTTNLKRNLKIVRTHIRKCQRVA
jgi:hypothetical protein